MTPNADRSPALGEALSDEHARLRRAFAEIASRAEAGDFVAYEQGWDAFASDLERHLRFEEAELFPRFEMTDSASGDEVARLSSEHHDLRSRVFDLGIELRAHTVQPDDVRDVLAAFDQLAAREDAILHPWATATFGSERPVCELE
jgi:hemerythrin-like domain-containing protein